MKRIISILLLLVLLFIPMRTYALDNYLDINNSNDVILEALNFYDLEFSRVSNNNFTISSLVYNSSASEIVSIEVSLYDSNKMLLDKIYDVSLFDEGYLSYEVIINYSDIESIKYYSLNIAVEDNVLLDNSVILIENDISTYYIYIIPIIFLLVVFFILFITKNKSFRLIDCYPNPNMNSVEFAYKYRDKFYTDYIYTMLIYLATKGYISIEHKDGYNINKVKEYDGNNELEKMFFEGLFISRVKESNHNYTLKSGKITFEQATKTLVKTILKISLKVENFKENSKEKKNNGYLLVIPLILVSYLIIVIKPMIEYYSFTLGIVMISLILVLLFIFLILLIMKKHLLLMGLVVGSLLGSVFYIIPAIIVDKGYFVGFFVGLVCIIGLIIYFNILKHRRDKYKKNLFLESITNMNIDLLEKLVLSNPHYIYDVLPFIMVLNLTDKYLISFENYLLDVPNWYIDNMAIDLKASFMKFMYYGYNDLVEGVNSNLNVRK